MKIIKVDNYEEMSFVAAEIVWKQIKSKPNSAIIFPTGSSPEGMYSLLVERYNDSKDDWSEVKAFNLDEYVGIKKTSPNSYYTFMHNNLYDHINIKQENIYIPNGEITSHNSINEFNSRFNKIKQIDLAILGIGVNGHIGFNEPGTSFDSKFRLIKLEASTIEANARNFSANLKAVPKKAMSMGITEIMSAKKIILIASGRLKADAIFKMVKGAVTEKCPASFLQKHKNIIVIVDQSAAINI